MKNKEKNLKEIELIFLEIQSILEDYKFSSKIDYGVYLEIKNLTIDGLATLYDILDEN